MGGCLGDEEKGALEGEGRGFGSLRRGVEGSERFRRADDGKKLVRLGEMVEFWNFFWGFWGFLLDRW